MTARLVYPAAVWLLGFLVGLALWNRISFPVDNPWGIIGQPALRGFHPANNIARFLVLVACPSLALLAARLLAPGWLRPPASPAPAPAAPPSRPLLAALLVGLAVLAALNIPTYHAWDPMNRFHEGESLGAAVSHLHGQVPYRDYLFVHGVWQDPLRSAVAFRLFGRSIGSARALESITKIVAFALLGGLLWELFRPRAAPAFAALLFVVALHGLVQLEAMWLPLAPLRLMQRDWTSMAFLLALVRLYRRAEAGRLAASPIPAFLLAFVALGSFGYSIDRGFFLTAAALVALALLYAGYLRGRGLALGFWLAVAAGAAASLVLVGFLLQWRFAEFARFTFRIMPRYKEWMDGLAYPLHLAPMWGIAALAGANLFQLTRHFLVEPRVSFFRGFFVEICLCCLSVFFFRAALGRADFVHVSVNSWPAYLLAFCLFGRPLLDRLGPWSVRATVVAALALAVICIVRVPRAGLLAQNFPFGLPDSRYLPPDYLSAARFLRENLRPGESFFTMTSEALWYYLVDKPCPTRFSVVWFAAPSFYQQEIIEDLKRRHVKFVLYRNQAPSNQIDGISNEQRLPLLAAYLQEAYAPFRTIDGHEIWIRR